MAARMTSAGRSCCRPAIHGRHRVVRVMVKPQPRAVACAGWFQRRVSPDPAPPPRFQPDVVVGAVGVIVTIVATVLMAIADLKTDLKADITSLKTDLKTDIKALSDKLGSVENK
eukprot:XP_001703796.1 predicted protein [Chlamydomonas reinhardtii]